ncbi:hypothetical protein ACSU1N_03595 [Thermogladius sp. 4427co]|uniref:hypothetical protein n=1 Tax=Thermogladius sp. 4427co TaxID=3450718 RepID=UPI003F79D3EB
MESSLKSRICDSMRALLYFSMLIIFVSVLTPTASTTTPYDTSQYITQIQDIEQELKPISQAGMNTSLVEYYVNNALQLISKGQLTSEEAAWVENNISLAWSELEKLKAEYPSYVLWKNIYTWASIALYASIPVITYFLLPRVWAYIWYWTKRKWRVARRR